MNKKVLLFIFIGFNFINLAKVGDGNLVELDKIVAIVNNRPITEKMIYRRGYDGTKYTLEDIIDFILLDDLGEKIKVNVNDEAISRYLQNIGADADQISKIIEYWGYADEDEFRNDLKIMYRGSSALNYEIESKISITEDDINKYYKNNIIKTDKKYLLRTAFVDLDSDKFSESGEDQDRYLKKLAKKYNSKFDKCLEWEWDPVIEIKPEEISEDNKFILDLSEGEIFIKKILDSNNKITGFNIFALQKIIEAGQVSLSKRRAEITKILQKDLYDNAVKQVKQELRNKADIYYLNK